MALWKGMAVVPSKIDGRPHVFSEKSRLKDFRFDGIETVSGTDTAHTALLRHTNCNSHKHVLKDIKWNLPSLSIWRCHKELL